MSEALPPGRSSGVLLHPTSLPGGSIGSIGPQALRFVDWLADAGQCVWQLLPLVAVDEGGSPYNGLSAFAGNPLLVEPRLLAGEGLLAGDEAGDADRAGRVDYPAVARERGRQLLAAFRAFRGGAAPALRNPFEIFRRQQAGWLPDYALFRALRERAGGSSWTEWPAPLRDRDPAALAAAREELEEAVENHAFQQFLFERQWQTLREHARRRGVSLMGDVPIFVAHDSADVWANRELFELDERGNPTVVAGVPPDYFSETGQRWGNPLYRWEALRESGYAWWVERFRRTLAWVDVVRIDHFRGFEAYWEVPAEEETALRGRWRRGPGRDFFDALARELGPLPVVAEDLGLITREVEELRDDLGFPGMRVLQFAFDGAPDNPHLPANHPENSVAYTGTHDNDTAVGWWLSASPAEREQVVAALGGRSGEVEWLLMEMVAHSPARLVVFPAQDLLGLGSHARMNTPGTAADNWSWRLDPDSLDPGLLLRLRELTDRSGRLPAGRKTDPTRERWSTS